MANINAYSPLFNGTAITPAIRKAAQRTRDYAEYRIKARTPVKTGNLKSQWKVELEGNGLRFRNDADYGIFVEMGTRRMNARPMLGPTAEEAKRVFAKEFSAEMSKILAKKIQVGLDKGTFKASSTTDEAVYQALTRGVREVEGGLGTKDSRGFGKMSKRRMTQWDKELGVAEPSEYLY